MSAMNSLHYQLCTEGAKWLRRRKHDWKKCETKPCHVKGEDGMFKFCPHCKTYNIVAVELNVTGAENPDVWGYDGYSTVVIEVKVSHSDFKADQKKMWRNVVPEHQAGNSRWYLCPEGIIKPDELPEGWGAALLERQAHLSRGGSHAKDAGLSCGHADSLQPDVPRGDDGQDV